AHADLVVNATPVGMGDDRSVPVPADVITPAHVVVDLVYHPLDTPLLTAARAAGASAVDGLGMLVHQAAPPVERWTGRAAPVDGRCCAALSSDAADAITDAPSLLVRLVDLAFGVARAEDGSFRFGVEEPPWQCPDTIDLEVATDELGRLLDEWREIQAVIPSL